MKKIIILGISTILAVASNAASINWTITNVYQPGSTTDKIVAGTAIAYLFVTENTTDVTTLATTTQETVLNLLKSGQMTDFAKKAALSKSNAAVGNFVGATGLSSKFSSGTLTAFAIIFDNADISSAKNYMLVSNGSEVSVAFTSPNGTKTLAFGDQTTTSQTGWVSIPEPTSGLLMLLGVAGLALKRKHV